MHPILFRIPLPDKSLPWAWVLFAVAGVAVLVAAWQFLAKHKETAIGAGVAAVGALGGALYLRGKPEPAMLELSAIPIYSYGVMLGLSLVVGWYLTIGLAAREGLPRETMMNCYVVTAIAAVLGSRILYILTNLDEFDSFGSMFAFRRGGLVAYGGFIGGFIGSYLFLRRHKIPLLPWADVAVPSLASGLLITRIGCYLFGCDFGHPLTASAPGWLQKLGTFPHWDEGTLEHGSGSPAWVHHVKQQLIPATTEHSLPVHPTQLYESLVGALLLGFLLLMRRYQKFRGQIFLLFTFAYGFFRFLLEIFRDDAERGSIPPALPEHLLLTFGLGVLSIGFLFGFSKMIRNPTVQRVAQVAAFVPPVLVYFLKKPETFAQASTYQLSTSQFVAITTGFGAAIAFNVFHRAALAHPESAMRIPLPPAEPSKDDEDLEDDDEDEEERPRPAKANAKEAAKKKSKAKKAKPEANGDAKATGADDAEARSDDTEPAETGDAPEAPEPKVSAKKTDRDAESAEGEG